MSNLSQFIGGSRPPKSIVNISSGGGVLQACPSGTLASSKPILSGALTANTLKTLLTISGAGAIKFLAARSLDATSRTIRLKITLDGVVVYDATSAAMTSDSYGMIAVGGMLSGAYEQLGNIEFNISLVVEVASSLTETDKVQLQTIYETR